MKVFQSLQKNMSALGLEPPKLDQKHPIKLKKMIILICWVKFLIFLMIGFLNKAITFSEYAELVQIILSSVASFIIYLVFIVKINRILKLINNFEIMIETRKFHLYLALSSFWYLLFSCCFFITKKKRFLIYIDRKVLIKILLLQNRDWKPSIEKNLRANKWEDRKMHTHYVFCLRESNSTRSHDSKANYQLLWLFYNWFGEWSVSLNLYGMVCLKFGISLNSK